MFFDAVYTKNLKDQNEVDLNELFHLPIKEAAEKIDMSVSCLKRLCRLKGIRRWPARSLQALFKFENRLLIDYPSQC
jgi:hypothetical protein